MSKTEEATGTHLFLMTHEIPRSRGYAKNADGGFKKDAAGNRISIITRPDLPIPAKERLFTITTSGVPNEMPDALMKRLVEQHVYRHGSFLDSTLFDAKVLKVGAVVTLAYNDILAAASKAREKKIKAPKDPREVWISRDPTAEELAGLSAEDKKWINAARKVKAEYLAAQIASISAVKSL